MKMSFRNKPCNNGKTFGRYLPVMHTTFSEHMWQLLDLCACLHQINRTNLIKSNQTCQIEISKSCQIVPNLDRDCTRDCTRDGTKLNFVLCQMFREIVIQI